MTTHVATQTENVLVPESPARSPLEERVGSEQRPVMRRAKSPTFDYDSSDILAPETQPSQPSQTPPPTLTDTQEIEEARYNLRSRASQVRRATSQTSTTFDTNLIRTLVGNKRKFDETGVEEIDDEDSLGVKLDSQ